MTANALRIGIAGLGTVGAGLVRLLNDNAELVERRAGRRLKVVAVSARDRQRKRDCDISGFGWVDDATELAERNDIDTVVELVGGADGPALALARACLGAGKHFVTANKAMIAHHGLALAQLAEASGAALKYEAAVAGGIPVIKVLRDGLAANRISSVSGILNGTCNYILSVMEQEGRDFAAVLADAQAKGYAEADPSFDVDGIDAAHKLAILATLCFGVHPMFSAVATDGIRAISATDLDYAAVLGYRVKLVGIARLEAGGLFQRVHPCLVSLSHPLAGVMGSTNAVVAEGNQAGRITLEGAGAGAGPTASAVAADLVDIARGEFGPAFAMPVGELAKLPSADPLDHIGRAYIRLSVADKPGVLAELAAIVRDCDVSVESVIQRGGAPDGGVYFVITTHATQLRNIDRALDQMRLSAHVLAPPVMMHILED